MSRRDFTKTVCATALLLGNNLPLTAKAAELNSADGVIQLKADGKLYVHSGGGHGGPYAIDNAIAAVGRVMNCATKDIYVIMGGNPRQLPVFLGQHLNHLSFSSAKTNMRAAETLKSVLKKQSNQHTGEMILLMEEGISTMTRSYIHSLDQEGIVVAVRQVD